MDLNQTVREGLIPLLPRLRRLARALAGQTADADDLVQVALEHALARSGQWRPQDALDKWVFAIMRNAWRDELRSRGRTQRLFAPEEASATAVDGDSGRPAQQLDLAAAVAALPPDHREVVVLVLVEGLSYDEAAGVLALPVGTVTSRLSRARTALQAHLGKSP
ncbi:MAG: RNA polymerase sigma factor [Luteimonas sp.]